MTPTCIIVRSQEDISRDYEKLLGDDRIATTGSRKYDMTWLKEHRAVITEHTTILFSDYIQLLPSLYTCLEVQSQPK